MKGNGTENGKAKKIRILFIAPYEGLKTLAVSLCEKDGRFDLDARVGDLEAGAALTRDLRGCDAIISRGGTAELIMETAKVPVVDIGLSQYDILHAVRLSQNYSGKSAVVGFPKIIERVESICTLLGYDVNINVIHSAGQVRECLERLKADGCSLIVGDTVTVATAKEMRMNGILIASGSESVLSALNEAERLCGIVSEAGREARMYKELLNCGGSLVFVLSAEGIVFSENGEYARESVGVSALPVAENWCRAAVGDVFRHGVSSLVRRHEGYFWTVSGRRGGGEFSGFAFFHVRRGAESATSEKTVRLQSTARSRSAANSSFYEGSPSSEKIAERIRRLGALALPVVLSGEPGTGKDAAAFEIYRYGGGGDRTFLSVDCRALDNRQLDALLLNEKSPLLENGIGVYFKRIDALNEAAQRRVVRFADDSLLHRRNRVFYSGETAPLRGRDDPGASGMLVARLLEESGQEYLPLFMPSLRERSADIPSIASIYINDLNIALGRQVAGLDEESTALLREFPWSGNMTQLKNVLRELVLVTDGAFIAGGDTGRVLKSERRCFDEPASSDFLRGTLDEISLKVIRRVLKEENMCQSNAARRLGISRSTLWRKLREQASEP